MESHELTKFKWILVLELAFAGAYVSITRGLFIIFLVSIGYGIEGISFVMLISAAIAVLMGIVINKYPTFITNNIRTKLIAFHGLERITWIFIPLFNKPMPVLALFSIYSIFSFFTSIFMNLVIYGSLEEKDLKDVLAKRSISGGASNVIGFVLGTFLLAFLRMNDKFIYIFGLGSLIGLLSTSLVLFLNLSSIEKSSVPKTIERPEKVFSASLFFVVLMTGGNLLGLVWAPYVMNYLRGPDYLVASMNLVGTMSSVVAAMVWRGKSLKTLRISNVLSALSPPLIWFTGIPSLHLVISAFNSFVYTGANFLGNFIFAEYKNWYGAVQSSVLLVILGNLSILLAAPIGMVVKEDYVLAFLAAFVILTISALLTLIVVPEVAIVSEDTARSYSFMLYRNCLTGYSITMEVSKETAMATLRLLAMMFTLIMLFIVYGFLIMIMS